MKDPIRIAALALCGWGLGANGCTPSRPPQPPAPEEVTLTEAPPRVGPDEPEAQRAVRITNGTRTPISFQGYAESQPWYRIQSWKNGTWQEHEVGWFCGTGLRKCVIEPGASFRIPFHAAPEVYPLRVGVEYSRGSVRETVWSARIE